MERIWKKGDVAPIRRRQRVQLRDLLLRAADLLEQHGWISPVDYHPAYGPYGHEGRLTLDGAIHEAYLQLSGGFPRGVNPWGGLDKDEDDRLAVAFWPPRSSLGRPLDLERRQDRSQATVTAFLHAQVEAVTDDGFLVVQDRQPVAVQPVTAPAITTVAGLAPAPFVVPPVVPKAPRQRQRRAVSVRSVRQRLHADNSPLRQGDKIPVAMDGADVGAITPYVMVRQIPVFDVNRVAGRRQYQFEGAWKGRPICLSGFFGTAGLLARLATEIANIEDAESRASKSEVA